MENIIKKLRIESGMTQRELSEKAGINIRHLQKFESGERDIANASLSICIKIADALEIDNLRDLVIKD